MSRGPERERPGAAVGAQGPPEAPPLSSVTLAELYERQGHSEAAIAVYRKVLEEDPDNGRAREGLRQVERARAQAAAALARKRRSLEMTIAGLEGLLGAARRR